MVRGGRGRSTRYRVEDSKAESAACGGFRAPQLERPRERETARAREPAGERESPRESARARERVGECRASKKFLASELRAKVSTLAGVTFCQFG